MRLRESLRLAWRSIRGHKLRSALTTLGVVIGVAAVITFVTLGVSLSAGILGEVGAEDASTIYVWASPPDQEGGPGQGAELVFTPRDVERLNDVDGVEAAFPWSPVPTESVAHGNETVPLRQGVYATGAAYLDPADIGEGDRFAEGEREAVINPAMAERFDRNVSVGDEIGVVVPGLGRQNATVVGILATSEGQSPFEGFGNEPRAYLPADPYYTSLSGDDESRYYSIAVRATGVESVGEARDGTRRYLESNASDASEFLGDDLELTLRTSEELLDQLRTVLNQLTSFVTGIAVISLLVGAIGIANIMLVSVTERTREIGIMKAVGASNRDVLTLFLTEAAILGLLGAVGGVLLGAAGGWAVTEYADLPLTYPFEWFAVAVAVGVLVGIAAGLYPAWRAARTDPIEALRYE